MSGKNSGGTGMRTALLSAALCLAASTAWAAESPEQLLQRAAQLADGGQAADAAKLYEEFLKLHPTHSQVVEAHYRLAQCLDSIGWVDEAVPHLEKVIDPAYRSYRQRTEAFYTLGKLHASLKKYDAAAAVFEKMLSEGAGLYEEEVMNLCAGYYAVLKKYDDAAAKLNLLLRRRNSQFAERAAYKLVVLWIEAEKLDFAISALEQLALEFPKNKQVPGLMVQIADLCRRQKKYREAVAVCSQLRERFPQSLEALAGGYVLGMCHRDRKEFDKAVKVFEEIARSPEHRQQGLAAEALLQSAAIHDFELGQTEKAMDRYEEAAKLARDSNSERKNEILEQCHFRLAEYYYNKKNYAVALEHYLLLRRVGTKLNILGRILRCQAELGTGPRTFGTADDELALIRKKVDENPGTFAAAEGEVFLIDRKLYAAVRQPRGVDFGKIASEYREILGKYPKNVLAESSLESYIYAQIGQCYSHGATPEALRAAIAAFEKSIEVDPATPYQIPSLESIAAIADRLGDKAKSFEAYQKLYQLTAEEQKAQGKEEPKLAEQNLDYLKAMLSRAYEKDSAAKSIELVQRIKDEKGVFSEEARHAQFYLGEIHFLTKNFSAAAAAFKDYIRTYGPKQDAKGEVEVAPWKPPQMDAKTDQLYEAAVRIAHAWYLQNHTQNMVEAYRWILRNFPHRNPYVAEAEYWLAMELAKGRKGQTAEGKRELCETLWKKVVNPSLSFGDKDFAAQYHFWVQRPGSAATQDQRYGSVQKYVKSAILKCAELYGELGEHESAARVLEQYLALYPLPPSRSGEEPPREETYDIARYALGREYIALGETGKLIQLFEPYISTSRDDRFRVSGLKLLGYHAGQHGRYNAATLAYATLLDEYGTNKLDKDGVPVPVPRSEWLRPTSYGWNGIRLPPPKDLDRAEIRFALGFLYWKMENWRQCVQTLEPLVADPAFRANPARPKALFMMGKSYYTMFDYANGAAILRRLIREHPNFEAIQEVYVHAARGCAETGDWRAIQELHETFAAQWPDADWRPRMDLYAALAALGFGQADKGLAQLKALSQSETFEDVKADAAFHVAMHLMNAKPPNDKEAATYFERSVQLLPRDRACLEAARLYLRIGQLEKARDLAHRVIREFPNADSRLLADARNLLTTILKQIANPGK